MYSQKKIIKFSSKNSMNETPPKRNIRNTKVKKIHHFKITKQETDTSPLNSFIENIYPSINDLSQQNTLIKVKNKQNRLKKKSNSNSKKKLKKENEEKEIKKIAKKMPLSSRASDSSLNIFQKSIPENNNRTNSIHSYFYSDIENCINYYSNSNYILENLHIRNFSSKIRNSKDKINSPKIDNNNINEFYNSNDEIQNPNIANNFVYKKAKAKNIIKDALAPANNRITVNTNKNINRCCMNKVILRSKNVPLIKNINYLPVDSQKNIINIKDNFQCSPVHNYNYNNNSVGKSYFYQSTDRKTSKNKFRNNSVNNKVNPFKYQKNNSTNNILNGIIINNNNNKYNNNNFNYFYGNYQKNFPNNYIQNVIKKYLISTFDNNLITNSPINKKSMLNSYNRSSDNIFQSIVNVQKKVLVIQKNYRMHLGRIKYNIIKIFSRYVDGLKIIKKIIKRKYLNRLVLNILLFTSRNSSKVNPTLSDELNEKNNNNNNNKYFYDLNNSIKKMDLLHKKVFNNNNYNNYNQFKNNLEQNNIFDYPTVEIESLSDSRNTLNEINNNIVIDRIEIKKIDFFPKQNDYKKKILETKNENIKKRKPSPKFYQMPNLDNFHNINSNNIFYKIYNKENTLRSKKKF